LLHYLSIPSKPMRAVTLPDSTSAEIMKLPIMEMFDTLQGEGFHTGKAAYFIRTAGCDVACHWCDVKASWDASTHPTLPFEKILAAVESSNAEIVVITGGEPLMYDMDVLCAFISEKGKKVHLETSGVYKLTGDFDWICFSPKKFKKPKEEYYKKAQELKVVIYHPNDLEWAEEHAAKMHRDARLYLQPEWSRRDQIMPMIVDHIRANPRWRISLQTHKYLNIP
jgi:7-carboxy-7-deazaguanine synthase